MREFRIIDAAVTVDQLRMRLKDDELEQYGEAFIPEFVYEIIRRLPRFASMRVSCGASLLPDDLLIIDSAVTSRTRKSSLDLSLRRCMMSAVEP